MGFVGSVICLLFIFVCTILTINNVNKIHIISFTAIYSLAILIHFWWRYRIKEKYIETLRINAQKETERKLAMQTQETERLKQQNDELSALIHKDNKLIPALELSVRTFLSRYEESPSDEALRQTGNELLSRLEKLTAERQGIIKDYENRNKTINLTGINSTDDILGYMLAKSIESDINFETSFSSDIAKDIENTVNTDDLNTVLADLIENAFISCRDSEKKNVLLDMSSVDDTLCISFFDSGNNFDLDVFSQMGLRRITTHANSGGSGIGLVTLFEMLRKYKASIIIKELDSESGIFTKEISLIFNKKNSFIILSPRSDKIADCVYGRDIIVKPLAPVA